MYTWYLRKHLFLSSLIHTHAHRETQRPDLYPPQEVEVLFKVQLTGVVSPGAGEQQQGEDGLTAMDVEGPPAV